MMVLVCVASAGFDGVFEFLSQAFFFGPNPCRGAEFAAAAGALPQVDGDFDFAWFCVGRAVPFFG